jgi:hypothetical protein
MPLVRQEGSKNLPVKLPSLPGSRDLTKKAGRRRKTRKTKARKTRRSGYY